VTRVGRTVAAGRPDLCQREILPTVRRPPWCQELKTGGEGGGEGRGEGGDEGGGRAAGRVGRWRGWGIAGRWGESALGQPGMGYNLSSGPNGTGWWLSFRGEGGGASAGNPKTISHRKDRRQVAEASPIDGHCTVDKRQWTTAAIRTYMRVCRPCPNVLTERCCFSQILISTTKIEYYRKG
jgi:hypothetical protein